MNVITIQFINYTPIVYGHSFLTLYYMSYTILFSKYHCCFGPEDNTNLVPEDMEALLDSAM